MYSGLPSVNINWTNTQVYKLIEMFQEREFLWNISLNDYKDRMKKYEAWCEIANEFGLDKHVVEKKMRSLVGQFQRELKKTKLGGGENDTSNWFAFKKMMFIKDRCKPGQNADTEYEERADDNEKEESEEIDLRENMEKEKMIHEAELRRMKETEFATPNVSNIRKRSRPRHDNDSSVETLSLLHNMYESRHQRDEFDVFGEHVAMKLRRLKSSCAKYTAQFHINNILYNADMGDYDWPSNAGRWRRSPGVAENSRSRFYEDPLSSSARHNIPGPSFISESSNDGSVSTVDDVKCEISDNHS